MTVPTQEQLDTCLEVLEWYTEHLKEHEPYAKQDIALLEDVVNTLPRDVADLET